MTSQQQLVCDNSTLANFKQWAQAISSFFSTAGWLQSSDTGQVNWSTISAVPGSGAFVYEIWEPNDGLTNFFVKMEYGNSTGSTNSPCIRVTISTTTNGAGTPSGLVLGGRMCAPSSFGAPSATSQYECDFSGAAGRIGAMMWRNGGNNCQQLFAIERSLNSSGAYTGSYVTLWTVGNNNNNTPSGNQQSLVFGVGAGPAMLSAGFSPGGQTTYGICSSRLGASTFNNNSATFNGSIPFDTCAPSVGFFDYPSTMVGIGLTGDFPEGVTFTITLYGATRTYMVSKSGPFTWANTAGGFNGSNCVVGMRYD